MNEDIVPRVTFTDPELAHVGLTEAQARARGDRHPGAAVALSRERPRPGRSATTAGHIKVVTDRRGSVLGATIVGAGAGELITTWTLAVSQTPQYPHVCWYYGALSDLGGDWKTRRHYLFHTQFDQPMGAAHHRLAAPLGLSRARRDQ